MDANDQAREVIALLAAQEMADPNIKATVRYQIVRNRWEAFWANHSAERFFVSIDDLCQEAKKRDSKIPEYELEAWIKQKWGVEYNSMKRGAILADLIWFLNTTKNAGGIDSLEEMSANASLESFRAPLVDAFDSRDIRLVDLPFYFGGMDENSDRGAFGAEAPLFGLARCLGTRIKIPATNKAEPWKVYGIIYCRLAAGQGIAVEDVTAAASAFVAVYTVVSKFADSMIAGIAGAFAAVVGWASSATVRFENIDEKCVEYRNAWTMIIDAGLSTSVKQTWALNLYKTRTRDIKEIDVLYNKVLGILQGI